MVQLSPINQGAAVGDYLNTSMMPNSRPTKAQMGKARAYSIDNTVIHSKPFDNIKDSPTDPIALILKQ